MGRIQAVDQLALRKPAVADGDALDLLASLALRAKEYEAEHVEPEIHRNLQEFVLTVRSLAGRADEDIVAIELDLVTGRQDTAQVNLVEHRPHV